MDKMQKIPCEGSEIVVDFQYMERYDIQDLRRIMALLRAPGGCPWDREQSKQRKLNYCKKYLIFEVRYFFIR